MYFSGIYPQAQSKAKDTNELIQKDYPTLLNDNSFCATDRREHSVCSVWQRALKTKENMIIQDEVDFIS